MSKTNRDERIVIRVAAPLRSELELEADNDGRPLAALVRLLLINHAEQRMAERGEAA
jgi:hypothetical protein